MVCNVLLFEHHWSLITCALFTFVTVLGYFERKFWKTVVEFCRNFLTGWDVWQCDWHEMIQNNDLDIGDDPEHYKDQGFFLKEFYHFVTWSSCMNFPDNSRSRWQLWNCFWDVECLPATNHSILLLFGVAIRIREFFSTEFKPLCDRGNCEDFAGL